MAQAKKFSSKLDANLLKMLRELSLDSKIDISALLDEAVRDLLEKKRMRPLVAKYLDDVCSEFAPALEKLAK